MRDEEVYMRLGEIRAARERSAPPAEPDTGIQDEDAAWNGLSEIVRSEMCRDSFNIGWRLGKPNAPVK